MTTHRSRPQVLTLTPAAVQRIKALLQEKGGGEGPGSGGLRIGVKKGGCAGMEYTLAWVAAAGPHDEAVEQDGARVLIEPAAVLYLLGTEMDWRTDKLSSRFVFNNPNQTSACGCGESVTLAAAAPGPLPAGL